MTRPAPKDILADNLAALMRHYEFVKKDGTPNQNALAKKLRNRPNQTTIGRILRKEISPTVEVLHDLAKGFDLHEWQLMVPFLDPKNPPVQVVCASERQFWQRLDEIKTNVSNGFKYKVM